MKFRVFCHWGNITVLREAELMKCYTKDEAEKAFFGKMDVQQANRILFRCEGKLFTKDHNHPWIPLDSDNQVFHTLEGKEGYFLLR